MTKITCGVNEVSNESFNGKTIAQVMESVGPILNIPRNPVILLNGEEITDRKAETGNRVNLVSEDFALPTP